MKGQGVFKSLADKCASTQLRVSKKKAACVRSVEASPVTLRDKMTTVVLCAVSQQFTLIAPSSPLSDFLMIFSTKAPAQSFFSSCPVQPSIKHFPGLVCTSNCELGTGRWGKGCVAIGANGGCFGGEALHVDGIIGPQEKRAVVGDNGQAV